MTTGADLYAAFSRMDGNPYVFGAELNGIPFDDIIRKRLPSDCSEGIERVCAFCNVRPTMVDGAATLMMMMWAFSAMGIWSEEKGTNMLDTGAPFYDTFECSDGEYVSIGSIEPQFYAQLLELTGLEKTFSERGESLPHQMDKAQWPVLKERLSAEYTLPVDFEMSRFSICRWISADDKAEVHRFIEAHRGDIARDLEQLVIRRFAVRCPHVRIEQP